MTCTSNDSSSLALWMDLNSRCGKISGKSESNKMKQRRGNDKEGKLTYYIIDKPSQIHVCTSNIFGVLFLLYVFDYSVGFNNSRVLRFQVRSLIQHIRFIYATQTQSDKSWDLVGGIVCRNSFCRNSRIDYQIFVSKHIMSKCKQKLIWFHSLLCRREYIRTCSFSSL